MYEHSSMKYKDNISWNVKTFSLLILLGFCQFVKKKVTLSQKEKQRKKTKKWSKFVSNKWTKTSLEG